MNPEIWTLASEPRIASLIDELAENEGLTVRRFTAVATPLNLEEPKGGLILIIEAAGEFANYIAIPPYPHVA